MSMHGFVVQHARAAGLAAFFAAATGCAGTAVTRESLIPIPEHPPGPGMSSTTRGTTRAAARIAPDQEVVILAEIVRRFYRPMMQQARWIDPRPLAHERTRQADSLEKPDHDWAIALAQATGLRRVCPLTEANDQCRGLAGGVLRFSQPYAVGAPGSQGTDSALVYVRYTPVSYGVEGEIEFFMVRSGGGWRIASKRSLPEIAASTPPRREITDPQEAVDSLIAADRARKHRHDSLYCSGDGRERAIEARGVLLHHLEAGVAY